LKQATFRHSIRNLKQFVVSLLLMGGASVALYAQSYYGGVRGAVLDQNGGAIGGAKVTLIDPGSNTQRAALTTAVGEFLFSEVIPATYTIVAEAPGFKKFENSGVVVGTQQQVSLDLKLEVGQVTDSVMVTEAAPLVETSNASQGQVIDNQKLTELPNLGRNPFMMSKLVQNIVLVGNPAFNRMEDQSGSSQISISGGPVRGNNYLIDGVPVTDADNRAIIIPTLEAVQEVKIQANTYDAEMARTGGGMFNTLMKSGTNDYHGSAYGHLRRTAWDANSFFNNAAGIPITNQPNDTWGASFGGRVWIPKVFDGKNKVFFFLGTETYDDTQSASSVFNTPTLLERKGDFSQSGVTIYNPLSLANGVRTPFPGNVIPTSMINPTGSAIASYYEVPQTAPSKYGAIDISSSASLPDRASQMTGKLDADIAKWWRASLSYLRYFSLEPGSAWFPSTVASPGLSELQRRVDSTQWNNLFTVNPTTVVTVRYGFNRFPNYTYTGSQGFNIANLGFAPSLVSQVPSSLSQFPYVAMTNPYVLGVSDANSYYDFSSNNFSASVAKYVGKHSLKAGFDYRRIKLAGNDANNASGSYAFNGIFTKSAPTGAGTGGADLADLLLGFPSSGSIYTSTKLYEYANYYGLYLQDDYRVTPKLTVNLGLRWEREPGLQESSGGILVGFDGSAANPLAAGVTGISPKGVVEYAGANGKDYAGNPNLNKLGPRVGLAWQLNDKTVIRAGYGLFWAPQFGLGAPVVTPGYNSTTSYIASTDNNQTPANNLTNPFPAGISQPVGKTLGPATGNGQTIALIAPGARSPRVNQFSLDVQRQLPFGIAAEVGYVGSRSSHLTLGEPNININALNPNLLSMGSALTQSVPNPFFGHGGTGVIGTATVQESQLLLPYPTFGAVNLQYNDNNHARYDSLLLKAQKSFSHGLTFLSTFTWSRNYDESSGGVGNSLNAGNLAPQNPYNLAAEWGLSNIDSPFRWATSFTYELPVGKGKPFLNSNKMLDYFVGGWTANAVSQFQTGYPLQITQATNFNSAFGYASQRPNATGVSPVTSGSLGARVGDYINPAAFSQAPEYTFGNISRTLDMRGPGLVNWDLSVFKTVTIREKLKAQFRCEALNAFNTPLFYGPNVSFGSSLFGKLTQQANFSRQLQLALRFSF
jgi:hypothetical protein